MKLPKSSGPTARIPTPFRVDQIGLGDVISMTTSAIGIRPCRSCEKRAQFLNRYVVFTGHADTSR
jgi:hypothetical protein